MYVPRDESYSRHWSLFPGQEIHGLHHQGGGETPHDLRPSVQQCCLDGLADVISSTVMSADLVPTRRLLL